MLLFIGRIVRAQRLACHTRVVVTSVYVASQMRKQVREGVRFLGRSESTWK